MKSLATLLLTLCVATPGFAEQPHHMGIVVQADRILIGEEFVPRYLDLPRVLTVPAGKTVTVPPDSTWDYIEVAGTLRVPRDHDTVLRFTHLFVLPGGVLDVGTQADPIPADWRVELIVRDAPIDTTRDPFQWGNGLLNFHRQTRVGGRKLAWTTLTGDVLAGANVLTLAVDPQGWRVGDELLLPDTRQTSLPSLPRRETPVTIVEITGRTVVLSKPLDFEHLSVRDPDGAVVLLPRVANLTRNIVVRSESLTAETGTPGHTANVGEHATWDVRYNEFVGLGRTRGIPIDSAVLATGHIGTNQVGRYNDHQHHAHGLGSFTVGDVYRGSGRGKWGLVVHGTHDGRFEDTIAVGFPGAGFVTEDGYEVRNVFRRNLALYSIGNHTGNVESDHANVLRNNPGSAGNGFWWRGVMNTFEANEAWNCAIGINMFNQNQVPGKFPSVAGGDHDTMLNHFTAVPVKFENNVTAANLVTGLEYWGVPKFPATNHVSAFNGHAQFFQGLSDSANPYFVNPTIVGAGGTTVCVSAQVAYTRALEVEGGRIVGCLNGVSGGGQVVRIVGTVFQNVTDLNYGIVPTLSSYHENVVHRLLPGHPPQFIVFGDDRAWNGELPLPPVAVSEWFYQRGSQHRIKNWQGTGQDFRLFVRQQLASVASWPSTATQHAQLWNCPEGGLTMGQSWAKYGMAYRGEALPDNEAVPLEGLVTGFAHPGLNATLGPPRGIVTYPTSYEPALIGKDGRITVWNILTGDSTSASDALMVSVDGAKPFLVGPRDDNPPDVRTFTTPNAALGQHEIRTWRTDAKRHPIEGSLMTFHYTVGAVSEPPNQATGRTRR